ncbi:unnamed protein product [Hymenolepis diminuta]|uniref:Uncharacterized protein n=1 Tax=Hymenolepis diminuta TaxID=6216 RepID=A0A564Y0J7_HYMDI|nr:unnamed protein product [Hymenolepis diminuta]
MLILRRTSSSSRLPYRRRRRQNCNNNWHEEDFYREPSTNSSTKQNPSNRGALTLTRQSHDRHWLRYLMLCNSTYFCGDQHIYIVEYLQILCINPVNVLPMIFQTGIYMHRLRWQ